MVVAENIDGVYRETTTRHTYEDAYTLEFKELYALVTQGKPVKTTAADAKEDLEISRMIMQAGAKLPFNTGSVTHKNGINGTNGQKS